MSTERLTIDTTAAIDYLREDRDRHPPAVDLFALAQEGHVEIAFATSAGPVDVKDPGQLRALVESETVKSTVQLSYPGLMYPGPDAYPGAGLGAWFRDAWDAVLADWGHPASRKRAWLHQHHGASPPLIRLLTGGLLVRVQPGE